MNKMIRKVKEIQTAEEQKKALEYRILSNIDNKLTHDKIDKAYSDKIKVFIEPKPKQSNYSNTRMYCFNERNYTKLNQALCEIVNKEEYLKSKNVDVSGLKSFNLNMWLDLLRESNAIEGIFLEESFDFFDFRLKIRELIDTNPDSIEFDRYEYFKKLIAIDKYFTSGKEEVDEKGLLIVFKDKSKHLISPELMRQFLALKFAYKCAKQDIYFDKKGITKTPKQKADELIELSLYVNGLISGNEFTRFRNTFIFVKGANWVPTNDRSIAPNLKALCKTIYDEKLNSKISPIELSALFHAEFVRIHPFMDGNGRTARILSNYLLIQNELPTISIQHSNRQGYFNAVNKAVEEHDLDDLVEIFYNGMQSSAKLILNTLKRIEKNEVRKIKSLDGQEK